MAEDVNVRCQARVLRLQPGTEHIKPSAALRIEHYEFLPRELAPIQSHYSEEVHLSRA
jgi:hypothetical protein